MGKKFSILKKAIIFSLFIILLLTFFAFWLSPYQSHNGFSYKLIKHTVQIDAPITYVFKFLGNSKNASKWSVFVHHITPLNADSVLDGAIGSRRRCFCNANETGTMWDELVTENILNSKRQITIYNLKNFSMTAEHLATEQLYEVIDQNKCKVTFTVFFKDATPTLLENIKIHIGAYRIKTIFEQNMSNIKCIVEQKKDG